MLKNMWGGGILCICVIFQSKCSFNKRLMKVTVSKLITMLQCRCNGRSGYGKYEVRGDRVSDVCYLTKSWCGLSRCLSIRRSSAACRASAVSISPLLIKSNNYKKTRFFEDCLWILDFKILDRNSQQVKFKTLSLIIIFFL